MKKTLNPTHLEALMKMANGGPFFSHIRIRLVEINYGYSKVELDIDPKIHINTFGSVHGGVNAAMIDTAAYWASYCGQEENSGFTTLDISVTNLSMARRGRLTAIAHSIKEGRSICLCDVKVYDEDGRIVSHGTSKLLVLEGRQSIKDAVASAGLNPLPPKFLD